MENCASISGDGTAFFLRCSIETHTRNPACSGGYFCRGKEVGAENTPLTSSEGLDRMQV
jgi:hypothetical protein